MGVLTFPIMERLLTVDRQQDLSTTTAYPVALNTNYEPSCMSPSTGPGYGYIFCVGGAGVATSGATEFAQLSNSGIGSWTGGTFPTAKNDATPCAILSGSTDYVYCLGGVNAADSTDSNTYVATVSSAGSRHGP